MHDFHRPDAETQLSSQANLVYGVGWLASQMVQITRTLCNHPDGRAENDAEHSYMLGLIAVALATQYYPNLDSGRVATYALVHDLVEAYAGDTATHDISDRDLRRKVNREAAGLAQLVTEYATIAPKFVEIIKAYERQNDAESRYVRMLDKLVTISIQFPDAGATMRSYFADSAAHKHMVDGRLARFLDDYADQKHILELYDELAVYMRHQVWPSEKDA